MIYLGLSLNTINLSSFKKHHLVSLVSQYELHYLVIQVSQSQWRIGDMSSTILYPLYHNVEL